MSIAEYGLRVATVRALRGKTFAGDMVLDEPGDPVSEVLTATASDCRPKAFIAVFTNLNVGEIAGGSLLVPSRGSVDLTIQIYLPPRVEVGTESGPLEVMGRDGAGKFVVDVIERQIISVLLVDESPWADLARAFRFKIIESRVQSFVVRSDDKAETGIEIMAREFVLKLEPIGEPEFGTEPSGPYARLIDLMGADASMAPLAGVLRDVIVSPAGLEYHRVQAALLGVPSAVATAIGLGPAAADQQGDPPPVSEIAVANQDGGGVTVDVADAGP